MKKILVLGSEGYIGYALCQHLVNKKYQVLGIDNQSRQKKVEEIGSDSLIPLEGRPINWAFKEGDVRDFALISEVLKDMQPDVIVHLAEQPSAPYSMIDVNKAVETQSNNVVGTLTLLWAMRLFCPSATLVKLAAMGEFGDWIYEKAKIPESNRITVFYDGYQIEIPTPHFSNSFYHWSKIFDTGNIEFACRLWGLKAIDIMQGSVYGQIGWTRFDYDEYFGTVINRFVTQAIARLPLTIYGRGGQTRGYLPLKDSIQCLELVIKHLPQKDEYIVVNQFEGLYSINQLANLVKEVGDKFKLDVQINSIENPRVEKEEHDYNVEHKKLLEWGYKPTTDMKAELRKMFKILLSHKGRIRPAVIMPKTKWR